jgi:hypothetical protein
LLDRSIAGLGRRYKDVPIRFVDSSTAFCSGNQRSEGLSLSKSRAAVDETAVCEKAAILVTKRGKPLENAFGIFALFLPQKWIPLKKKSGLPRRKRSAAGTEDRKIKAIGVDLE